MKLKLALAFIGCLFISSITLAAPILPGVLVDVDWLVENIDDVKILDVRADLDSFLREGHIPGAVVVDTNKVRVTRTINGREITRLIPERKDFDNFIAGHGISNGDVIIITNEGKSAGDVAGATRLYWQLKVYGYDQVALLDGGNRSWLDEHEDFTKDDVIIKAGSFKTSGGDPSILATTADVEAVLKNKSSTLVDTRSLRQHIGLSQKSYVYAPGHIPSSRLLPYKFVTAEKGSIKFLPAATVQKTLNSLGIDPMARLILYCNSAYECSSVWFVLHELMGNKNVAVYDGALHEWTMDKTRPMTTMLGQ